MWYRAFLIGLMVVAIASTSCNDKKDEILFGDPVAGGMGALGASAAAVGAAAVTGLVNATAQGSLPKPSAGNVVVGLFPEGTPPVTVPCDTGDISVTGNRSTDFTANFNACASSGYTISGSAVVSNMVLRNPPCDEDGQDTDVPQSLHAVINATANIDGQDLTLTGLTFDASNPTYSEGSGGTCSLESATVVISGGSVSTSLAGETISAAYSPTNDVTVDVTDAVGSTTLEINGDTNVTAPCATSGYQVAIVTVQPLVFPDGSLDPSSGIVSGNGETVDVTGTIPEICDGAAFGG